MDVIMTIARAGMIHTLPLWFASLGEFVQQRAGILGIGMEGAMLMGAFASYLIALETGMLWLGVLGGFSIGLFTGLFMAVCTVILGRSQIATGIGLNIFAAGMSGYLFHEFVVGPHPVIPFVCQLRVVPIPLLEQIPVVGYIFFNHSLLLYSAFLLFPLVGVLLYRTSIGLKVRAVGESAQKCDLTGINVRVTRTLATVFAYTLAGVAGASLVLYGVGTFIHGLTGGRGFMAIAIVIVSNWRLKAIAVFCLLFGIVMKMQIILQIIFPWLPWQLMLAVPYMFAIFALMIISLKARQPAELGIPFVKHK